MVASSPQDLVRLTAPAKLTLSLRVTGTRDDGYHLIDAEMVTLDFADDIELVPIDDDDSSSSSAGAGAGAARIAEAPRFELIDAETGRPGAIPVGPDNLVARALALVDRRAHVRLIKRIPPGAGLGGGSADAAAVLRWAGFDDLEAAARLGADVSFCVRGGRARVTGIGEVIEPLPFVARTITLVTPPFGCSTPEVYAAWDRLGSHGGGGRGLDRGVGGPNDLEPAALEVQPRLAQYRDELREATGQIPVLAGSGSTWFVEGAYPGDGRIVAHTTPSAPV